MKDGSAATIFMGAMLLVFLAIVLSVFSDRNMQRLQQPVRALNVPTAALTPTLAPPPVATDPPAALDVASNGCSRFYPNNLQLYVDCLLSASMPAGCSVVVQNGWVGGPPLYTGAEITSILNEPFPYNVGLPDGQTGQRTSPYNSVVYTNCREVQLVIVELGRRSIRQGGALD